MPEKQRRWGYYVLPVLYGDQFVARFDGRYEKETSTLHVLAYNDEPGGLPMTHPAIEAAFERFLNYLDGKKIAFKKTKKNRQRSQEKDVNPFGEPLKIAKLMETFGKPWFIAGGWAIDLFLERVTRAHKDIEIAILRSDQLALKEYLKDWELKKIIPKTGGRMEVWDYDEYLELPIHEIHGVRANSSLSHLEILLNESDENHWKFRRNSQITRPLAKIGLRSDLAVPFLAPEIVLLYKSTHPTRNDHADFLNVHQALNQEQRHWLRRAIEMCHPGHEWLGRFDLAHL
jgi:hypothetical protein